MNIPNHIQEQINKKASEMYGTEKEKELWISAMKFGYSLSTPESEYNGWVSVTDRLPEVGSRVWVYKLDVALMCYGACFYNDKKFYFDYSLLPFSDELDKKLGKVVRGVTHWKPLPEPPK